MEAKRRLRGLRDAAIGAPLPVQLRHIVQMARDERSTDEELLVVLGEYLSQRTAGPEALLPPFRQALQETMESDPVNYLAVLSLLHPYGGRARLRTPLDVELEQLEGVAPEPPPEPRPIFRPAVAAPAPAPRATVVFQYVVNPSSDTPRIESVAGDAESAQDIIRALIEEHAVAVVPPASLARAIHHYAFDLTEAQRQVWNKEKCGRFVFHKLKRGIARIYVRRDNGTVTFHVYARRDWDKTKIGH